MSWSFLDNQGRLKQLLQSQGINPTQQVFTTGTGTYVAPIGCTEIFVECIGGGGGGGSSQTGSNSTYAAASGGNGGCYSAKLITNPNSSYAYSVGAGGTGSPGGTTLSAGHVGGDTTFGSSLVVAKGGLGGQPDGQAGHTAFATTNPQEPSTSGCVGDFFSPGDAGTPGMVFASAQLEGGGGGRGGGPYGGGGPYPVTSLGNGTGQNGIGYGSGGGGSTAGTFSGGDVASGTGAGGIIVVTEFYGVRSTGGGGFASFNVTSQDLSVGPPSNPKGGDIWYATNVDGNGTVWQFRYNSGSASTFKWEFVGGPAVQVVVDTFETTTTAWPTVADLTTVGPSWTAPRAGDYEYMFSVRANNNTAGISTVALVTYVTGGVTTNDSVQCVTTSSTASTDEMGVEQGKVTADSNTAIKLRYSTLSSGTARFGQRRLWITPVRVS